MKNKILLLSIAFMIAYAADAATYYISSSSGNDNNNGTSPGTPWKTIDKVNAQHYVSGDKILFKGKEIFDGTIYLNEQNVALASPASITISSYGGGAATINAGAGSGIDVYNVAGIKITHLIIHGAWNAAAQSGNDGSGISFYCDKRNGAKLSGISISRCDVSGFKYAGIGIGAFPNDKSESGFTNISVTYNKVHDNGDAGMSSYGYYPAKPTDTSYAHTNMYVGWNIFYNNLGIKGKGNNSGNGVVLGQTKNAIIEHCVAYNNGWLNDNAAGGPVGIWCYDSKNITIQYCEAHDNGTGAGTADGDGFDFDGGVVNSIMQYNYSHHNWGAGYLIYEYGVPRINNKNNIIRYNISQNDAYGTQGYTGIYIAGNCDSNYFYNNTIYSTVSSALYAGKGGGVANWFANNIFYCNNSKRIVDAPNGACTFLGNNYYSGSYPLKIFYSGSNYTTLAGFRAAGQETYNSTAYGFNTNPLLNDAGNAGNIDNGNANIITNYKLNAGSPMIDAAFNLTTLGWYVGAADFSGVVIPQSGVYDVGACEFVQTAVAKDEIQTASKIILYPNPAKDKIIIISQHAMQKIIVTDIAGRQLLQLNAGNALQAQIDLHSLQPGLYFITAMSNGKVLAKEKIIKE